MRLAVIAVLLLAAYCEARPSIDFNARPFFGSSFIVGGVNAEEGEFPWQLSQQRGGGASWSHSCGASLLSSTRALSAAHCVDGAATSALRIVAGLWERTSSNGVASLVSGYKMHENWNVGSGSFPNDIAIITLATPILADGKNIGYAQLPADNSNNFAGQTGVISGWGRNSASNSLPLILQKASIGVLTTEECNVNLKGIGSADDTQICLYDNDLKRGSCNGDSGGPFNIVNGAGQIVVAGVTSWGVQGGWPRQCLQNYPSVYTRVSAYLDWIKANSQ